MSPEIVAVQMKFTIMPGPAEMLERLREAECYGVASPLNTTLDRFIGQVALRRICGEGIVTALNMSEDQSLPPTVISAMRIYYNQVIDAVTPDPEVTQNAINCWEKLQEFRKSTGNKG